MNGSRLLTRMTAGASGRRKRDTTSMPKPTPEVGTQGRALFHLARDPHPPHVSASPPSGIHGSNDPAGTGPARGLLFFHTEPPTAPGSGGSDLQHSTAIFPFGRRVEPGGPRCLHVGLCAGQPHVIFLRRPPCQRC